MVHNYTTQQHNATYCNSNNLVLNSIPSVSNPKNLAYKQNLTPIKSSSICLDSISCVNTRLCLLTKETLEHITFLEAAYYSSGHKLARRVKPTKISMSRSSVSTKIQGFFCCLFVDLVTKNMCLPASGFNKRE